MLKQIYFIQHCESEHHINGMTGSWTDWHLTERGIKQAENIAKRLKDKLNADTLFISSDLNRAVETLKPLCDLFGTKPVLDKRIREIYIGKEPMGKSVEWFKDNADLNAEKPFPDAESWEEFDSRIREFMHELLELENESIVVTAHGGSLSRLLSGLMGMDSVTLEISGKAAGVSLIEIKGNKKYLRFLNDMSYSV